jgi:3-hydroxybutyryl-CoA dehydrogenase
VEIRKVGVVGCGLMGAGIAEVCARAGYSTVVSEINQPLLDKGMSLSRSSLDTAVKRGKVTEQDRGAILGRIQGTIKVEDFGDCDLVIEAVIENLELKKRIFADLDRICPKHAILASNTSCLSILDMAMVTKRPSQVVGIHFFQPAPVMRLVEIVRTIVTADETVATAKAFAESVGKKTVFCKDMPGFIVNRIGVPLILHSIRLFEQGLATKEDIDQSIRLGLNHPLGPLELADFIGLDTVYNIAIAMYDEFRDPLYAPPILLKKMVAASQLGRKTGKGFYDYKDKAG